MNKFEHGGDIYSRQITYDFSANINPLGLPDGIKDVLTRQVEEYSNYPDVNCRALRTAIAELEKVCTEQIVCGNGAADLIYRIVWALKPGKALLPVPTFSEYEKALESVGCSVDYHLLCEEADFALKDDFLDKIRGNDIIFLCNPNNPTGRIVPEALLCRILAACQESECTLVLDECFLDFTGAGSMVEEDGTVADSGWNSRSLFGGNVIILKAFTKIYAMAGLRLGYCLCGDVKLAEAIQNCGQCWSVSVPAQLAGVAALKEKDYVKQTVELISGEREYLAASLERLGFQVYPSEANFLLFWCGAPLDRLLLEEGIAIRSCANYRGLKYGYFRIAVRSHAENEALIRGIERVL